MAQVRILLSRGHFIEETHVNRLSLPMQEEHFLQNRGISTNGEDREGLLLILHGTVHSSIGIIIKEYFFKKLEHK